MKKLLLISAFVLVANTANAMTTEEWMSLDNPHNYSKEETVAALGEVGEFLVDLNESIESAAKTVVKFVKKI